jgi:probable HAF family extracellular repeat protein
VGGYSLGGPFHSFDLIKGQLTTIDPPGALSSQATGINNHGVIVGFLQTSNTDFGHGYIDDHGRFTQIDDPSATLGTALEGINNQNQAVGVYGDELGTHGFLYDNGKFSTIDVPGSTFTEARGINDLGQIVGDYQDSNGSVYGFVDTNGTISTIDVPPDALGSFSTVLNNINNHGQIVGTFYHNSSDVRGFVGDPARGPRDVLASTQMSTDDFVAGNPTMQSAGPQVSPDETGSLRMTTVGDVGTVALIVAPPGQSRRAYFGTADRRAALLVCRGRA